MGEQSLEKKLRIRRHAHSLEWISKSVKKRLVVRVRSDSVSFRFLFQHNFFLYVLYILLVKQREKGGIESRERWMNYITSQSRICYSTCACPSDEKIVSCTYFFRYFHFLVYFLSLFLVQMNEICLLVYVRENLMLTFSCLIFTFSSH